MPVPDRVVGGPDREAVALGGFPRDGLGLLLLGHVAEEHGEPVLDRIGPRLDPDRPTVRPDIAMDQRDRDPFAHRPLVVLPEFAVLGPRIQVPVRAPEQFLARAAFDTQRLDIQVDDAELPVEQRKALAHPVENALGPGFTLAQAAFGQHLAGDLVAGTEEAGDLPGLVAHGGVGEAEMRLLQIAATLHEEGDVVHVDGVARIGPLDDRHEVGTDLLPHLQKVAPQRCGMLRRQDLGVGIVVEQRALRPPGDEHGLVGRQHDADQRLQRRRPVLRRPEARPGPGERTQAFAHHAAAGQKRGTGRSGVTDSLICHGLNIAPAHSGHQLVPVPKSAIPVPPARPCRRPGSDGGRAVRRKMSGSCVPQVVPCGRFNARIGHTTPGNASGGPGAINTRLSTHSRARSPRPGTQALLAARPRPARPHRRTSRPGARAAAVLRSAFGR